MTGVKILLIEDHQMVREGIRFMLESSRENNFIIHESSTGEEGFKLFLENDYDIIIIDFQLPDCEGVDIIKKIIKEKSSSKILTLSNYDEIFYIQSAINAGAKGYVLKNISKKDLFDAIENVKRGESYYSHDISKRLIENPPAVKRNHELSEREIEIIKLISEEKTNEEIGVILNLSKRTVDTHRQRILEKLNAKNTAGLIRIAMSEKII